MNAGEASVDGFELDVIAAITENTTVTLNYTYLDSELSGVVVPNNSFLLSGPPASAQDLRGQDISSTTFVPFAPENAFAASFDYSRPLAGGSSVDLHLNYSWRDELYSQSGQGLPVESLGLLGARLAWSDVQLGGTFLTVAVWGKNLTDEEEVVYNLSGFGFQYNMPITYGVDLKLEF